MRRREVLGVLGTLGLSGCLRLTGGDDSDETPTAAPTTAASTTDAATTDRPQTTDQQETTEQTEAPPTYPAGLSDDGVNDALFASHLRELAGQSFQSEWTKIDVSDGRNDVLWQKAYRADRGRALGEWTRRDGGPLAVYRSGSESYWREEVGDRVTYGLDNEGLDYGKVLWGIEVSNLISSLSWSAPELAENGDPAVWRVQATGVEDESAVPGHQDGTTKSVSNAAMEVTEAGVIRSLEATYTIRNEREGGEDRPFSSTYAVEKDDGISVTEPDWLSEAETKVPSLSASVTDDGRAVKVVVESGNRIEAESRFSIWNPDTDEKTIVNLDDPLERGTEAYLYKDEADAHLDGHFHGDISRGSPPSGSVAGTFEGDLQLGALRKTMTYAPRFDFS